MVNRLLFLSLLSLSLFINSCSYMTKQKSWPVARQEMEEYVDKFVNKCVGRDIVKDPYPNVGFKFYRKYTTGTGEEGFKGQCTFSKGQGGYYSTFNKDYFLYQRWLEFVNILKSRFGVIYHDATKFINGCVKGELHDFLLRDGKTHLILQFANDYGGMYGCKQTYWQGVSLQLNRKGLASPSTFRPKEDESYLIRRIDVINKDHLTELEKRELAMSWKQLSEEEKEQKTKSIASEIRSSKSLLSFWAQERRDMINLRRETRRREREREKAFLDQLDQQLAKGMMGLQQQVIQKQQKDHQRAMQRQVSKVDFPQPSQSYSQRASATKIFKDIKGFNTDQLNENISYREESVEQEKQQEARPKPREAEEKKTEKKEKTTRTKVYEPAPEVVEREMDSWFSDKNLAIAYSRLKATNDLKAICEQKDAKSDPIRFAQIEAGNAPLRWSFSAPDCRQGGWKDEEWKCRAKVSGTCFRYQEVTTGT